MLSYLALKGRTKELIWEAKGFVLRSLNSRKKETGSHCAASPSEPEPPLRYPAS